MTGLQLATPLLTTLGCTVGTTLQGKDHEIGFPETLPEKQARLLTLF